MLQRMEVSVTIRLHLLCLASLAGLEEERKEWKEYEGNTLSPIYLRTYQTVYLSIYFSLLLFNCFHCIFLDEDWELDDPFADYEGE